MDSNNPYTRKIVMATNVAESSITVDGIVYVIDNGMAMVASYFPKEDARSLIEERISQAAAQQRKGRAGRTSAGFCYRLYTEEEFKKFSPFPTPDIQKTDITSDILDIYSLKYVKTTGDVKKFLNKLLSPPSNDFVKSSLKKLYGLGAISSIDDKGVITELGKGLSKFRAIEPNFAKAIIASYYYYCKYDVIYAILGAIQIDSRIDGLFEKYRPSKFNISESMMKKEKEDLERKQKKFYSKDGDYITILNVYYALKDYMKNNPYGNPVYWCKENGINKRAFISKYGGEKWDLLGEKARKVNDTLEKIVKPMELRKKYYNIYHKNGGIENISELNKEINQIKNMIIDPDDDILENLPISDKIMQSGGYNAKPYELNLFPNAIKSNSKQNNILMSLAIGNITNMATLIDKKGIYRTIFPLEKVNCSFDKGSTLKMKPKYVMYHELFTMRKDQKVLKLNLVTKLSPEIMNTIKKDYTQFMEKNNFNLNIKNEKTKMQKGKTKIYKGKIKLQKGKIKLQKQIFKKKRMIFKKKKF
jgi:HrpA-like RNA helicase